MTTFSMIPGNNPAKDTKGAFKFDVVFTSNQPGFVVQYLRKKQTYKKTASSRWKKTDRAYWEIFYIGDDRMSWNADRFAQTSLGKESEGCLIQIGYAYFFPYHLSDEEQKTYKTDANLSASLKRIFGKKVQRGKIEMANGLPSSLHKPKMKGLHPLPKAIIHKLTVKWGEHAKPLGSQLTSEGWVSVVVEEVFAGKKIFQEFPWASEEKIFQEFPWAWAWKRPRRRTGKGSCQEFTQRDTCPERCLWKNSQCYSTRPLLKDQNEKDKYLSPKDWEETVLNYLVAPIQCPFCQQHLREGNL